MTNAGLLGPNTAFCLFVFGLLGIYCEFVWLGRIWQAAIGSAALATGTFYLWRAEPTPLGLKLLVIAFLLFLLDAFAETYFAAGTGATFAMTFGFLRLIDGDGAIYPWLCVPWCLLIGGVTMLLNWVGRRARRNKRADLTGPLPSTGAVSHNEDQSPADPQN